MIVNASPLGKFNLCISDVRHGCYNQIVHYGAQREATWAALIKFKRYLMMPVP